MTNIEIIYVQKAIQRLQKLLFSEKLETPVIEEINKSIRLLESGLEYERRNTQSYPRSR